MISDIKNRIERLFSHCAQMAYRHCFLFLLIGTGLIGFLAYQTVFIRINTASEALLHDTDPKRIEYNRFRAQFGRPELIIVMIKTEAIFDTSFLDHLAAFHQTLEQKVPFVRSVTSLINIRDIRYHQGKLSITTLLENRSEQDLKTIQSRALSSGLYRNYILSEDGKTTALIIETQARVGEDQHFFGAKENEKVVTAVHDIVEQYDQPGFRLIASGEPVVEDAFNRATLRDLAVCVSLSLVVVGFFLIVLFQRISGIFLSMMITVCTLISTMGLMAVFDIQIKVTTIVMPAFIVAVSVAASIHVLVIFFRHHEKTRDKQAAIAFAMGHSGLAIGMTSLTTAAGLLSFSFAELVAIAEIGYLSAAGVMLSFLYTVFLLPAMLAVIPVRQAPPGKRTLVMDRFLARVARFACSHSTSIILSSLILFLLSIWFMLNLTFSHDLLRFFPENSRARQDILEIDRVMKGSLSLELIITHPDKTVFDLDTLNRMDRFSEAIKAVEMDGVSVGKVFSVTDVVKTVNQAFNHDISLFYLIPQEPGVIASGIRQLGGQMDDDLARFVDQSTHTDRMTVITTWTDAMIFKKFIVKIQEIFHSIFDDGYMLVVTGLISLLAQATHAATMSMVQSYAIAVVVITMMMMLMLGQVRLGLISMIPNLLPICMVMGLMGFLHTPFDLNSLMMGSVAIGLVVDDTVHFMYHFQRYHDRTGDVDDAVLTTFLGTGKAMLITSLVLSSGFFVLLAASLSHVSRFGIFTGLIILVALLADFLLVPAMMVAIYGRRPGRA